jgi:LysR family transcriptional regulator, glycine cleavage system transcriptional activator
VADLKAGRVVLPFAVAPPQRGGWYLVCRKERALDCRIGRLLDWLAAEVAADGLGWG